MNKTINRTGELFKTKNGGTLKIIKYFDNKNCTVLFEDGTILYNRQYNNIIMMKCLNPNEISLSGVGFLGVGKYSRKTHKMYYNKWSNMLTRCYDKKYQKAKPTYIGCAVDEKWHNFQNFAKWMDENYNPET